MSQKFKSELELEALNNASTDTDKFLVSDNGIIKYRTGIELLNDINGQSLLTNPVTGTGTINKLPKFTGSGTLDNSQIFDTGTNVGIGTTSLGAKLDVNGDGRFQTNLTIGLTTNNNGTRTVFNGSTAGRSFQIANNWNVGGSFEITPSTTTAGSTFTTPALVINGTTSNVGIGTTAPGAKLQIGPAGNTGALSVQSLLAGDNVITGRDYAGEEFFLVKGALDDNSMEINIGDYYDSYGLPYLKLNASNVIFNNTNVGVGTATPDSSAILHLQSTRKGFLPPVMRESEREAIDSPAPGLMIFNSDTRRINVFDGDNWQTVAWA